MCAMTKENQALNVENKNLINEIKRIYLKLRPSDEIVLYESPTINNPLLTGLGFFSLKS